MNYKLQYSEWDMVGADMSSKTTAILQGWQLQYLSIHMSSLWVQFPYRRCSTGDRQRVSAKHIIMVVVMRTNINIDCGQLSEWFKELVLKTNVQKCTKGSNPLLSATWRGGRVAYYTSLLRKSGDILPPWVQIPPSPPINMVLQLRWIEQWFPKPCVGSSSLSRTTIGLLDNLP